LALVGLALMELTQLPVLIVFSIPSRQLVAVLVGFLMNRLLGSKEGQLAAVVAPVGAREMLGKVSRVVLARLHRLEQTQTVAVVAVGRQPKVVTEQRQLVATVARGLVHRLPVLRWVEPVVVEVVVLTGALGLPQTAVALVILLVRQLLGLSTQVVVEVERGRARAAQAVPVSLFSRFPLKPSLPFPPVLHRLAR
jgi:hypothetical protein